MLHCAPDKIDGRTNKKRPNGRKDTGHKDMDQLQTPETRLLFDVNLVVHRFFAKRITRDDTDVCAYCGSVDTANTPSLSVLHGMNSGRPSTRR